MRADGGRVVLEHRDEARRRAVDAGIGRVVEHLDRRLSREIDRGLTIVGEINIRRVDEHYHAAVRIHRHVVRRDDGYTVNAAARSEEHTSELQSLMRISYAVFCLTKKKNKSLMIPYDPNYHTHQHTPSI